MMDDHGNLTHEATPIENGAPSLFWDALMQLPRIVERARWDEATQEAVTTAAERVEAKPETLAAMPEEERPKYVARSVPRNRLEYKRNENTYYRYVIYSNDAKVLEYLSPSVPDVSGQAEARDMLLKGWPTLNALEHKVVVLRYIENWTLKAIAEHLGTTPSNVRNIIERVRVKFEKLCT